MRIRELFLTIAVLLAASWPLSGQRPTSRRLPVDLEAIVDVDGDAAGRVYLIENRRNRLLVLDSTFAIVAEVANVLSDSTAVVMEQRAVRVLDRKRFVRVERYLRRLDVFEWRGGQVAKVLATRFPFEVEDACPVGGDTLLSRPLNTCHSSGGVVRCSGDACRRADPAPSRPRGEAAHGRADA